MTVLDLIRELRAAGIRIRVDGDRLVVRSPGGQLEPELARRVREHKSELLSLLQEAEASSGSMVGESLKGLADAEHPTLAPVQRRFWKLQRMDPESTVYNGPGAFRLKGPLDRDALQSAFQAMVERHQILRSRFLDNEGEPLLVIAEKVEVEILDSDLSQVMTAEGEAGMRAFLESSADLPLDLEKGPPFRIHLARLGPDDHALLFVTHSLVWDGWSFDLLLRELKAHYEAALEGRTDPLPPLPIQFTDYSAWQQKRLERGDFDADLEYWSRRLQGPFPPMNLPADQPRRPDLDYDGARVWHRVEGETLKGLRSLAEAEGATMFMVLLAAVDVLLHRYTGAQDIILSSPLQGRTHPELEDLLGVFTNTLFFRASVRPDQSFRSLLQEVKETSFEAVEHQEAPSELVIEAMEREGVGRPPHEVLFVFQQAAARPTTMGPVSMRSIMRGIRRVPVELMAWMREYEDYLDGGFDYRASLFEGGRMRRMANHFVLLLESVARTPDLPVSDLPMLSEIEMEELKEWTGPSAPAPRLETFPVLGPGAQVVLGQDRTAPGELEGGLQRIRGQISAALADLPTDPRQPWFGLVLDGSLETLLALEVARERRASVLLFPSGAAASEIGERMSALGVSHFVAGPRFPLDAAGGIGTVVRLSLEVNPGSVSVTEADRASGDSGILFGSPGPLGSCTTGPRPWTSVEEEAGGLARHLAIESGTGLALYPDGSVEQWVPVALAVLGGGGTLFLPEPGQPLDGWELDEQIENGDLTRLVAGPGALGQLIDTGWEAPVDHLLLGDPHAPDSLLEALDGRCHRLEVGWGMPEVGGWLLMGVGGDKTPLGSPLLKPSPWSPPLAILDAEGQPLPLGVPGEIRVGAVQGLNTGQRARRASDGQLALEGRRDRWENLGGHFVDLGAIESECRALEPILDVHLQAHEQGWQRRLVGHIVLRPGRTIDEEELRRKIGDKVPSQRGQISFVTHSELPRTSLGGVDERVLRIRTEERSGDRGRTEPQTEEERALVEVWKEALGLSEIHVADKFFELGGHSLLAIQVTMRLEEERGLRIDTRSLFFDTLRQVAAGAKPVAAKPATRT